MEGFGLIWADWTKLHMEKIWKNLKKIKDWKQWMPWILSNFVDLKASLYDQESKPNCLGQKTAQELTLHTWKIAWKNSKLKSTLEVDSSPNLDPISFLG